MHFKGIMGVGQFYLPLVQIGLISLEDNLWIFASRKYVSLKKLFKSLMKDRTTKQALQA